MGQKIIKVKIFQYSCVNSLAVVHSGIFSPIRTQRAGPGMTAHSDVSVVIKSTRVMCCGWLLEASLHENFFSVSDPVGSNINFASDSKTSIHKISGSGVGHVNFSMDLKASTTEIS